jgi:hypothetical protein
MSRSPEVQKYVQRVLDSLENGSQQQCDLFSAAFNPSNEQTTQLAAHARATPLYTSPKALSTILPGNPALTQVIPICSDPPLVST